MEVRKVSPLLIAGIFSSIISFVIIDATNCFSQAEKSPKLYHSEIVASWPSGTWLENLIWDNQGNLYITDVIHKTIFKYSLASNSVSEFSKIEGHPLGLAIDDDGAIYVSGLKIAPGQPGSMDSNVIYKIDKQGNSSLFLEAPKARGLNGLTYFSPGVFLICDSWAGVIWKLDVKKRTITEWAKHPLLATKTPAPGANGIKLYKNFAFVSNSSQASIVKIAFDPDGNSSDIQVYKENACRDDFCISENGNIYAAGRSKNVVYLVKETGNSIVIADEENDVKGNTAVVFGRNEGDAEWIYVIGDGGLWEAGGNPSKMKSATLVKIYVGEKGYFTQK
jgi:sugar lactone lactonase YvrE